jgi:hypothetical protein
VVVTTVEIVGQDGKDMVDVIMVVCVTASQVGVGQVVVVEINLVRNVVGKYTLP